MTDETPGTPAGATHTGGHQVGQPLMGPPVGPPETRLPAEPHDVVTAALAAGRTPVEVVAEHPAVSLAWAELAENELRSVLARPGASPADFVSAYASARVGYHRGLDALRRAGWRGAGPVPWAHEPNRGFLRCLRALALAADRIGETDEAARCTDFLEACDPAAATGVA